MSRKLRFSELPPEIQAYYSELTNYWHDEIYKYDDEMYIVKVYTDGEVNHVWTQTDGKWDFKVL